MARVYSGPPRSGGAGERLVGAASGHAGAELFFGVAFATVGLGAALCETREQCSVARVEFCFGLDEIEGVGEQLGGFAEGAAVELALDSLFGGGVEGDGHGTSIDRERSGGKRFLLRLWASHWPAAAWSSFIALKAARWMGYPALGFVIYFRHGPTAWECRRWR